MEFQFHPASGRATVRTLSLGQRGQRTLVALAAALASLAVSLFVTVPVVTMRLLRQQDSARAALEGKTRRTERARLAERAEVLRRRVLDRGDLLNRVAFRYDIPSGEWPQILNPERAILSKAGPEQTVAVVGHYLVGLERGRVLLSEREQSDADLPNRVPAILPFAGQPIEPGAYFGPRVSPWTGEEEFFPGVDIAASGGSPVVAPSSGTVVFAGTVRHSLVGWFWRLGKVVVISHGRAGATVYGHLSKIDVHRGQRVHRGDRVGAVGATGWALSPQLHYEYWRRTGEQLRPSDPLFAGLDSRLGRFMSLEQMEATSAPGPLGPLPGIGISAAEAGGPATSPAGPPRRLRKRTI
ncbi:MAG TPA: M23 family metallopeptidase [Thermoanaerobaculia bacterium]|nr:M23 family metallopeptidase [Thermoanaerobaculia bacterium]